MALLRERPPEPFFLSVGFFETHRPYPPERYDPADPDAVAVPGYLPDTPDIRQDLADFYGSITVADAAVGELLERARVADEAQVATMVERTVDAFGRLGEGG